MNCPVCVDERLIISERNGIEIDYCPECRGLARSRSLIKSSNGRNTISRTKTMNPLRRNRSRIDRGYEHKLTQKARIVLGELFD